MTDFIPAPSRPTATTPHRVPSTAVAALVLGLLSFILSISTGIAAVVCGHKALGEINRSGEILPGLTEFVPVFARVQENGQITMVVNDAHQVSLAIELYKEKNGTFPETLQQLVDEQFLDFDAPLERRLLPEPHL